MGPSRRRWRRWHRQEPVEGQVTAAPSAADKAAAGAEEVEELSNEIAELRQQTDELRHDLKETQAQLGAVEDDNRERARIIETLLEWCHEQESVLSQHRDVVAAMGAAARILEQDAPIGDQASAMRPEDEEL